MPLMPSWRQIWWLLQQKYQSFTKASESPAQETQATEELVKQSHALKHQLTEILTNNDPTQVPRKILIEQLILPLNAILQHAELAVALNQKLDQMCQTKTHENEKLRHEITLLNEKFTNWCQRDKLRKRLHELEKTTIRYETWIDELTDTISLLKTNITIWQLRHDEAHKRYQSVRHKCEQYEAKYGQLSQSRPPIPNPWEESRE